MKVATWNVGGCRLALQPGAAEDVDYFARVLASMSPDVVFLQEAHVFQAPTRRAHPEELAERLGYEHVRIQELSESHLDETASLALAILSRSPLDEVAYEPLPTPPLTASTPGGIWHLFPRGVLSASATFDGEEIALACAHAHPFHRFGRDALDPSLALSWEVLDSTLKRLVADRPLLAGIDLNDARYERLLPRTLGEGVRPAFCEPTTPDGRQQDYLLYSTDAFRAESWQILPTLADHHLAVATLQAIPAAIVS